MTGIPSTVLPSENLVLRPPDILKLKNIMLSKSDALTDFKEEAVRNWSTHPEPEESY